MLRESIKGSSTTCSETTKPMIIAYEWKFMSYINFSIKSVPLKKL